MGCQPQNLGDIGSPPREHTPIHERGIAGTTWEDVKAAAEVSGSHVSGTGL